MQKFERLIGILLYWVMIAVALLAFSMVAAGTILYLTGEMPNTQKVGRECGTSN